MTNVLVHAMLCRIAQSSCSWRQNEDVAHKSQTDVGNKFHAVCPEKLRGP